METLREILAPDFLLRNSVYVSLLAGFASPLIGVFLVMRRLVFLGVALPQISSTGIALALSLHVWFGHEPARAHDPTQQNLAFLGSTVVTLLAIVWFALLERRGRGALEGRLGTAYAVAIATSLLLLARCPQAERGWLSLLKGEIIAVPTRDLLFTAGTFAVVLTALFIFRKEFLLVSFDRDLALTFRKRAAAWDLFLYLLIGATIAVTVLSVGPLIAFGFMLIPTLIARLFAGTMSQLAIGSSFIGGTSALAGFWIAYAWDLPVGPTDVALLGAIYGIAYLTKVAMTRRLPLTRPEQTGAYP